jgi:hypothetical protein
VSYADFKEILKGTGNEQQIAADARDMLAGQAPRGANPGLAAEVNTWIVHQEGHRNIGALATHAMALDVAARGAMSLQDAVDMAPMSPEGAPAQARGLAKYLNNSRAQALRPGLKYVQQADGLAQREMTMIRVWVESLADLKISEKADPKEKEKQLILEIRKRIHKLYALQGGEIPSAAVFLKSLESTNVIL